MNNTPTASLGGVLFDSYELAELRLGFALKTGAVDPSDKPRIVSVKKPRRKPQYMIALGHS